MSGMIIRTPTRTKTKSFNGKQMDFTFPPSGELPRDTMDEHTLDNHRILNEALKAKNQDDFEASSQIFSDYTSASNANTNSGNSSNYYSFANISDNTTTSPRLFPQNNSMMPPPILEHKVSSYQERSPSVSLDPQSTRIQSNYSFTNSLQNLRDATNAKSVTMESTAPTMTHQTIPTADNISVNFSDITGYDDNEFLIDNSTPEIIKDDIAMPAIQETTKDHKKVQSVVKTDITMATLAPPKPLNLENTPSIQKVYSNSLLTSSMNSSQPVKTPRSSRSTASSRSSLKRSNAVRCKGGLLQYFTQMGIRVRRQFKKLRLVIRGKLFRLKKNSKNPSRNNSVRSGMSVSRLPKLRNNNNKQRQESSSFAPHTLHQKRTQAYSSKLQKSISMRSLEPALITPTIPEKVEPKSVIPTKLEKEQAVVPQKIKNTPSLRRTPSSIRRAASILTSTVNTPKSATNNRNSIIEGDNYQSSRYSSRNSSLKSKTRLVRSSGSNALSSIARQPSIVVKNKVIPLSMSRFSIKEEIAEEDEDDSDDSFDYYLETQPVDEVSPVSSAEAEDLKSTHIYGTNTGDIKTLYKHYLSTIIAERIRARVQMAKDAEESKRVQLSVDTSAQSSKDPIVSILTEYESSAESNLFEEDTEPTTPVTTRNEDEKGSSKDSVQDESEEDNEEGLSALPGLPPLNVRNNHHSTMSIAIQSPFSSDNASSTSIFCIPVKRSLTLPVSMKLV
ncbi:Altered inheritance of mitochondria protein 44 [Nakaseomyces bracarensis]|uniref:Altered inheritance of mitochondria protein 44 n=1 Tax=Nakaseomyces bracarensis TaxID=273131 RepID=A0ABR4NU55_9SACH